MQSLACSMLVVAEMDSSHLNRILNAGRVSHTTPLSCALTSAGKEMVIEVVSFSSLTHGCHWGGVVEKRINTLSDNGTCSGRVLGFVMKC